MVTVRVNACIEQHVSMDNYTIFWEYIKFLLPKYYIIFHLYVSLFFCQLQKKERCFMVQTKYDRFNSVQDCNVLYIIKIQKIKYDFLFFYNLGCPRQRFIDTCTLTNPKGHATPYQHVYHDNRKVLPWVDGPARIRTSE